MREVTKPIALDETLQQVVTQLALMGGSVTVHYTEDTGKTAEQKAQARANIGAGTSNFSGNYNDLENKPTIPDLTPYRTAANQDTIDNALDGRLDTVEGLIPAQATAQNQLADKAFVNSSIASETAHYISDGGNPFTDPSQLPTQGVNNNDYAFVSGRDTAGNSYYDRYKATVASGVVTWAKEYRLNNSSFTAEQWASISSGISAVLVLSYSSHIANNAIHASAEEKATWNGKQSPMAVKTTIDATLLVNTTYTLGSMSTLAAALPVSEAVGDVIEVLVTAAANITPAITGSTKGETLPAMVSGKKYHILYRYDGSEWWCNYEFG